MLSCSLHLGLVRRHQCKEAWKPYLSISPASIACSAASLAAVTAACCSSDSFLASALAAEILAATAWRASLSLSLRCRLGSAPLAALLGLLSVPVFAEDLHGRQMMSTAPMRDGQSGHALTLSVRRPLGTNEYWRC